MLQTKTKEQRNHIEDIAEKHLKTSYREFCDFLHCNVYENYDDTMKYNKNIQLSIMREIVYYIVMADAFTAMICTCSLGSVTEKIVFVSSALTLLLLSAYAIACEDKGDEKGDRPDFKRFLEKHGAYESFCKNLRNQRMLRFEEYIILYDHAFVSGAFTWEETPEGFDYWHFVHEEWKIEVKNTEKEGE